MSDENKNEINNQKCDIDNDDFDLSKQRKISKEIGDPEVQGLHDKYLRGRLDVQPDFQRQFVWNDKQSSRLIESAMLGIPLPVVYLSQEEDGKVSVIDGQQRLTAFFSFIEGKFKLTGLKIFKEFNKNKFSEIPQQYQEKVTECKLRTITFLPDSDEDLKFEIFERLNSGSVKLNDQELRNCIYRGKYNDLLRELSKDEDYMKIMGYSNPHKRMLDIEYVLRFASFFHQTYLKYNPPVKKFMNKEMEQRRAVSDKDLRKLRTAFKNSVSIIYSLLGVNAFRRFISGNEKDRNGKWRGRFNASLFDILMWSFAEKDRNLIFANLDPIKKGLIDLMSSNQDFVNSIMRSTSSKKRVEQRFDIWKKELSEILENRTKQPRCFSRQLKQELYDSSPTCQMCQNRIVDIDDAAVDHMEQYWKGGKTIPENARLVHRYCNNARPRKN